MYINIIEYAWNSSNNRDGLLKWLKIINAYIVINSLFSNTYFTLTQTETRPCMLYIVQYVVGDSRAKEDIELKLRSIIN